MSPYRLLIVGAGGFGREVHGWITADPSSIRLDAPWWLGGFLDANETALDKFEIGLPIIGDPATYQPESSDRFVCAIGTPNVKLQICKRLSARGAAFVSIVASNAYIGPRCTLGTGCVLIRQTMLLADVVLGDYVMLNASATVGHDAILGDGCTLSGHCDVTGGARLGEGVFLGSHACVAPGIHVGDFARIGAGSSVLQDVPAYTTVLGVPAKKLFTRPTRTGE